MLRRAILAVAAVLGATACTAVSSSGFGGGDVGPGTPEGTYGGGSSSGGAENAGVGAPGGATPGGAQDIGYARGVIAAGNVPAANSMTVEGLLSEHDIPTEGPACTGILCARPATAFAPSIETGKNEKWIQIGMTSGLTDFRRPPMDAVVLIDKGGSMGIDIAQVEAGVSTMIDELRDDDRLAILTFDSTSHVVKPLGPLGDRNALKAQVKAIPADGPSNLMDGLSAAFDAARSAGTDATRLRRVMLFSCGYPDSSTTGTGSYVDLVTHAANDDHVGLSFFGVLLGFDFTLADKMSHARGGSYSYLESLDKVQQVFDTDFDFMVTPIAYDLHFELDLPSSLKVTKLYGIPGDPGGAPKTSFDVSTAFISRRRGAIVARAADALLGEGGESAAPSVRLSYAPETAVMNAAPVDETTAGAAFDTSTATYSGPGVRKAVFLVNELEGMQKGCGAWLSGDRAGGRAAIDALLALMHSEQAAMKDPALDPEVALVEHLRKNMDQ